MKEQFATFEISSVIKDLGFNEPCFAFYNPTIKRFVGLQNEKTLYYPEFGGESNNWNGENHLISAPLWQQAIDWLRVKHNIHVEIRLNIFSNKDYYYVIRSDKAFVQSHKYVIDPVLSTDYEYVRELAIRDAIFRAKGPEKLNIFVSKLIEEQSSQK